MTKFTGKAIFYFIASVLSGFVMGMFFYRLINNASTLTISDISVGILAFICLGYSIVFSSNKVERR